MNTHPILLAALLLSTAHITRSAEERYCIPFIPQGGDTVLSTKEEVIRSEKVFMTFIAPKKLWDSIEPVDLDDPSAYGFTFKDAYNRAESFHGDNPPSSSKSKNKLLSTELVSIERISSTSTTNKDKPRGKYFYYVHIIHTYAPSQSDSPEQPVHARVIVLPNGWAGYPMFQYMKISNEG